MRMMWQMLAIVAAAYGALALLLYVSQSRLVYYPETGRELIATPAQLDLPFEDLHLKTSDGVELHGWFIPAAQPRGTVLFLHGNAGNISHRLDSIQMFHRLAYNTLIFDYRGYGDSGGKPGEEGTYRDAEAAWRYLIEQRHAPACRIVLFGESMGGAIAAQLAAREKRHIYPWLPVRWLARIRYDTRAYLRGVTAPVLIAHSAQDEIVPFDHGRALFAAAKPPKQFLELAGGHNDGFIFMRESWVSALKEFLAKQTDGACVP
jgi:fermentation-respiration switch protein FrsA (DUF1100 family)